MGKASRWTFHLPKTLYVIWVVSLLRTVLYSATSKIWGPLMQAICGEWLCSNACTSTLVFRSWNYWVATQYKGKMADLLPQSKMQHFKRGLGKNLFTAFPDGGRISSDNQCGSDSRRDCTCSSMTSLSVHLYMAWGQTLLSWGSFQHVIQDARSNFLPFEETTKIVSRCEDVINDTISPVLLLEHNLHDLIDKTLRAQKQRLTVNS